MKRKTWMILLGVAAAGLLAQYAWTQNCTPGYAPGASTIGDIQTECVAKYPAPRDRTDVGIGEKVTCSINPNTWNGTAIYTDFYCYQSSVSDPLGSITWSVSGPGSVYPTIGDSTTLTIGLTNKDSVVTVFASAADSLAVNAPVQKQKALNAKVPTGVDPIGYADRPPYQLGVDLIGCRTDFLVQVLPKSVNFDNTSLRENIAKYEWTWPNGRRDQIAAKIIGPVKPKTKQVGQLMVPNTYGDLVAAYGTSLTVDLLKNKKTGQFVDFDEPNCPVPLEYQYKDSDGNLKWANFDNKGTRPIHWTGKTQKGRSAVAVTAGTLWGSDQGPFEKPN